MQQNAEQLYVPLKPYCYPVAIYIFGLVLISLFCAALWIMPLYTNADRILFKANSALFHKKYEKALSLYEILLRDFPNYKDIRISAAIACFGLETHEKALQAMDYLKGIQLDKNEWNRVNSIMPVSLQEYFATEKG